METCQVNISYGEACGIPNAGQCSDLINNLVNQNMIFVCSAGNNGPGLCTLGAPGGTMDQVIGVGAYVTRSMMDAEYAMLENVPERPFTWSSRGPAFDGNIGVDIYTPGAAIT